MIAIVTVMCAVITVAMGMFTLRKVKELHVSVNVFSAGLDVVHVKVL